MIDSLLAIEAAPESNDETQLVSNLAYPGTPPRHSNDTLQIAFHKEANKQVYIT
jgi:hypothetical protein